MSDIGELNRLQLVEREYRRLLKALEEWCMVDDHGPGLRDDLNLQGFPVRVLYCQGYVSRTGEPCGRVLYHDGECGP